MAVECLSKGWGAYRRNFWQIIGGLLIVALVMFGIIIITGIPVFIKIISLFAASSNAPSLMQILSDGGVQSLLALFAAGVVAAIIAGTALEAGLVKMYAGALKGKAEIGTIFAVAREKFWTIIGANVLAGIIRIALFLVLVFPPLMAILISAFNAASFQYSYASPPVFVPVIGTMLWFYGSLIIYMLLALPFTLVNQAVVVGNHRAVDSIKKSFSAVKRNYLQFLGLTVLVALISALVSLVPVLGSLANFFVVVPVAGLAYTAFYIAKAQNSGRAGSAQGKISGRRKRKRSG